MTITIKVREGCDDIMWHLYDFGKEVNNRRDEKPLMTPSIRRTMDGYFCRDFCKGGKTWEAVAWNTTKGTTVSAMLRP